MLALSYKTMGRKQNPLTSSDLEGTGWLNGGSPLMFAHACPAHHKYLSQCSKYTPHNHLCILWVFLSHWNAGPVEGAGVYWSVSLAGVPREVPTMQEGTGAKMSHTAGHKMVRTGSPPSLPGQDKGISLQTRWTGNLRYALTGQKNRFITRWHSFTYSKLEKWKFFLFKMFMNMHIHTHYILEHLDLN